MVRILQQENRSCSKSTVGNGPRFETSSAKVIGPEYGLSKRWQLHSESQYFMAGLLYLVTMWNNSQSVRLRSSNVLSSRQNGGPSLIHVLQVVDLRSRYDDRVPISLFDACGRLVLRWPPSPETKSLLFQDSVTMLQDQFNFLVTDQIQKTSWQI